MKNNTNYKIAKKYEKYIDNIVKDEDGIWINLIDEVISPSTDCGTIHEYTLAQCICELRNICDKKYNCIFKPRKK